MSDYIYTYLCTDAPAIIILCHDTMLIIIKNTSVYSLWYIALNCSWYINGTIVACIIYDGTKQEY